MDYRAKSGRCLECRRSDDKYCSGCDRSLPRDLFYRRSSGGFVTRCKSCTGLAGLGRKRTPEAKARRVLDTAERLRGDLGFRIAHHVAGYLRRAVRADSGRKAARTEGLLGCTIREFMAHIEPQWTVGMSWENWGRDKDDWQFDHIRPIASFDLSDPAQQRQCFHFSNYQPLWKLDNVRKGARWAA